MKLRARMLIALGITFFVAGIMTWAWSNKALLTGFEDLENKRAHDALERVQRALLTSFEELNYRGQDLALSKDTIQFVNKPSEGYIVENFDASRLDKLNIQAACVTNTAGEIVYGYGGKATPESPQMSPERIVSWLKARNLLNPQSARSGSVGIVTIDAEPLVLSINSIQDPQTPTRILGWVIYGRSLGTRVEEFLQRTTRQAVDLAPMSRVVTLDESVADELNAGTGAYVQVMSESHAIGYFAMRDLQNQRALLITATMPRQDYLYGKSVVSSNLWVLGVIAVFLCYVFAVLVDHFVLLRLRRLGRQIEAVMPDGTFAVGQRVKSTYGDEIGVLTDQINLMLEKIDDGARALELSKSKLRAHNQDLEVAIIERTREIEHQAFHDKLTGLPNRRLFVDRLEVAIKKTGRGQGGVAVIFLDIDNFKLINDTLGHDHGDELLKVVSYRLLNHVRPGDTIARIGGDEFTILLENVSCVEDAVDIAERILVSLRQPFMLHGHESFAGASIGISFARDARTSGPNLLKNADIAMYRAKSEGKMSVQVFDESMQEYVVERLELETALRKALVHQELFVAFQPLVALETDEILGAEALVRWNHPQKGLVSPATFIPVAEETGQIIEIGFWVLEQACLQAVRWIKEFEIPEFEMSVNLSGKQLQRDDIVDRVKDVLERTKLPARNLKLEITETILMEDREEVIMKMTALKNLGVKLALDDFGTGYSSLSTLRVFPIDTLKIDRLFISKLEEEEGALAIVEAITAMARSMKIDVTGEGVETHQQREMIRYLGCKTGQGFLYDRPLLPVDFELRLGSAVERSAA